jgi:predicted O-methyltransferase YrrM
MLLAELIELHRPKVFVEIGTASGFSAKLIARCMNEHEGERLLTFDVAETWYGDTTKPVGFLSAELRDSGFPVAIEIVPGSTSADVQTRLNGSQVDAAFIDGSHYHPWATLDTMLVLPRMRSGGFLALHDLHLYMLEDYRDQFGPKFLFDQIPESRRRADEEKPYAISYAIFPPDDYRNLESAMAKSLLLPWAGGAAHAVRALPEIQSQIETDWGPDIACILARILARP